MEKGLDCFMTINDKKKKNNRITEKIIIADDDKYIVDSLKKLLIQAGYSVIGTAYDGLELYEKALALEPDIAFVDIEMPVLNGIKATELLKEKCNVKCVIMITSFDDSHYINRAIKAGASGYITKPVNKALVLPTIEGALRNAEKIRKADKEYNRIEKRQKDGVIIQKAKLILMGNKKISEDEAYNYIKAFSERQNTSMVNVSEIIIKNEEKNYEA